MEAFGVKRHSPRRFCDRSRHWKGVLLTGLGAQVIGNPCLRMRAEREDLWLICLPCPSSPLVSHGYWLDSSSEV
jgi:hypothetical protein